MVAVIAGTPVDTSMGKALLEEHGYEAVSFPISDTPEEQSILQVLYPERLRKIIEGKVDEVKAKGMDTVFVYCNSISAAVDMEEIGRVRGVRMITPLMVYRDLGKSYGRLAVIAANSQSACGIEKALQSGKSDTRVIGLGALELVDAVESGMAPRKIVDGFDLAGLLGFFKTAGCEALVLGCTHFSWFRDALADKSPIKVIDPALMMLEMLQT
jgi:glutamate racemase